MSESISLSFSKGILIISKNNFIFLEIDYTYSRIDGGGGGRREKLQKYNKIGEIIHSDPGYEESPIGQLEQMILERDENKSHFYAIVAPSYTGKSQTAFTFKSLKPLYFLLSQLGDGMQLLYENFLILSYFLENALKNDLAELKRLNSQTGRQGDVIDQISATELKTVHGDIKFKALGFIIALIEHANSEFNLSGDQRWMEFYVTSARNFTVEAKSINDLSDYDFGNFVMFFDEVGEDDWSIFALNIFRAAKFPVIHIYTYANVANIVGKVTPGDSELSLVIAKLNSMNQTLLNSIYPNFMDKIEEIIAAAGNDNERILIRGFFDNFIREQLKNLRSGFADLIVDGFLKIEISNFLEVTLNKLLEQIVEKMTCRAEIVKSGMLSCIEGFLGSLALFTKNAYVPNGSGDLEHKIFHMETYLRNNYYYLMNPVDKDYWCFQVFRPEADGKPLRVLVNNEFKDWDVEYTYFRKEEIIPLIFCQCFNLSTPIPTSFKNGLEIAKASQKTSRRIRNVDDSRNLKFVPSICVIEATTHNFKNCCSTFSGQEGKSFLTNLVSNLIEEDKYRRSENVTLNCDIIEATLKCVHVPYLFPADMKLPEFFDQHFSSTEKFNNRSVHFGEFIDHSFKFFIKNGTDIPSIGSCLVESEYWGKIMTTSALIPLLKKPSNMSLIFCKSFQLSNNINTIISYCKN